MDARLKRISSDYEQIMKDFEGNPYIKVVPIGGEPPEKYHVTYFVDGIFLQQDGTVMKLNQHEVEITLHADYPRYKPICNILSPIWHPNFRDGQICIGDIWGAGESLSDIIVNIGHMIQYKSWNSSSPLSADAAAWALNNKQLFPIGNIDLYLAESNEGNDSFDIDLLDETVSVGAEAPVEAAAEAPIAPVEAEVEAPVAPAEAAEEAPASPVEAPAAEAPVAVAAPAPVEESGNDFDITAEELEGIEYIPTADRMQSMSPAAMNAGGKLNFKTVLTKGIMWAAIGAILAIGIGEVANIVFSNANVAKFLGHDKLSAYYQAVDEYNAVSEEVYKDMKEYCKANNLDPNDNNSIYAWLSNDSDATQLFAKYTAASTSASTAYKAAYSDFNNDENALLSAVKSVSRLSTGIWAGLVALFIGLFMGIGEGVYYGNKKNAGKFGLIGAGISLAIGFVSGYLAQTLYSTIITDSSSVISAAFLRGVGWAIMGLGIGLAVGLIKPDSKRILSCCIGGFGGAFLGGFIFEIISSFGIGAIASRAIGILITGLLIGVGVGILEQFAKSAWLKVIRGEFEGKEYLVFQGITSIGNNNSNTIVLFKDKLIGAHHCDIEQQGSSYILRDCGTPMGTIVNGMNIQTRVLRSGDTISIGNSVLVFNTK